MSIFSCSFDEIALDFIQIDEIRFEYIYNLGVVIISLYRIYLVSNK